MTDFINIIQGSSFRTLLDITDKLTEGEIYDLMVSKAQEYVQDPNKTTKMSMSVASLMFFLKTSVWASSIEAAASRARGVKATYDLTRPCLN